MLTTSPPAHQPTSHDVAPASTGRPEATWTQNFVTSLLGVWVLLGLHLDGWAHENISSLETFFTPWHAVMYSGLAATIGWVYFVVLRKRAAGWRGFAAIPRGYELGVLGLGLFAAGGFGDMLWHTVFGIEKGVDALLSPTHLLMAAGGALVFTSPLRSAWGSANAAEDRPGFLRFLPTLISMTLLVGLLSFFLAYISAFTTPEPWAARAGLSSGRGGGLVAGLRITSQSRGIGAVLLTTAVLLGPLAMMMQRWRLPFGVCTVLFGMSALLINLPVNVPFALGIVAAFGAGAATDALIQILQPSPRRGWAVRLVATVSPVILWSAFFLLGQYQFGLGWSLEMVTGTITLSAAAGFLLSVAALPPALPERLTR